MKIRTGELDKRIVLIEPKFIQGNYGTSPAAPVEHPKVWAKFMPEGGGESTEADAVVAVSRAKFIVRYRNDICDSWLIKDWLGNEYRILNLYELNRRDYLVICCEARNVQP